MIKGVQISCEGCGRTTNINPRLDGLCRHCYKFIREKGLTKEVYLKLLDAIGDTMDDCQLCGKTKKESGSPILYFGLQKGSTHTHHIHLCEGCLRTIYQQWKG